MLKDKKGDMPEAYPLIIIIINFPAYFFFGSFLFMFS